MKLRITITGPRVHDVGYRYFLLGGAMGLRLPGFDANNLIDGKNQVIDIVIDGKESQVEAFKEFAEAKKPSGAEVSSIIFSNYDGDVMRMAEYSQVLTAMQMLKAIPTMLEIRDSTRRIDETTRRTEEKIGGIEETSRRTEEKIGRIEETSRRTEEKIGRIEETSRRTEERIGGIEETSRRTEEKIGRIEETSRRTEEKIGRIEETSRRTEENTRAIPAIADGVRELRSDEILDIDWKRRMESDIKAIKEKIGIV